jgi:hypothetical protein
VLDLHKETTLPACGSIHPPHAYVFGLAEPAGLADRTAVHHCPVDWCSLCRAKEPAYSENVNIARSSGLTPTGSCQLRSLVRGHGALL